MSHLPSLKRGLCATTLAALLATTAMAFAQTAPAPTGTPGAAAEAPRAHRGMTRPERPDAGPQAHQHMQERMQKHLADFKTRLKIEPAQESAWTTWTAAMQPTAEMHARREKMRAEMNHLTTPERIDRMKAMRAERDATMDKRAQATKDFYAQLNAEQKKTFDAGSRRFADRHGKRHEGGHGGSPGHQG
ncbi:MAG: hypothetical protein RLZZ126_46 [Pseudomonadota bacterium]